MSIEQKIVEWDNDNTSFCSLCKDRFGYFDRHHHCRLCGRVVCTKEKQCSTLLTLNHLRKLQKKIGMRQLKEKLHPTLRNYPVRACRRCHHLLRRREQECDDKKAQADPLTEQYQLWRAKRDEIEDLVEEGESIRDKVYVSPEDVERSVELRRSIKLLLAACDALGKQIAVAPPVAPTQSNAQQRTPKQATQQANSVQAMAIRTNIRRAIIQYMQRRLMDVQLFPIKPSPKPPPAPILAPATRTRSATVDITQNRSNQCKLTGTMSQSNIRAAVNNGTGSR
ncbi:hypothetical protein, variant [Sphaeroforma arctica JP610]|uniref:FYVE-type domain-containing protein n=1 Tax=Sphaeroforma arctica JP610 TaxID=667725 RepID=A0A0L0FR48_9EUKA|nr:hypothetical protein, variant [Sphaeroforma arctica JP610]KNC78478.1 hypothetical protein, variant [Sphaeroforma arctica JP610]|eukprot:XP_014152380.1 hypothetical protein, variant [Sphaeroforma arctica JP610]